MPGNELEDRVHNFFAQDNSLQGQHQSQSVEGNWPVLNSNFWAGNHRQDSTLNSSNITYNPQNSDTDRGPGSYPHHVTHGLNFTQSNLRPDAAKSRSLNDPPNLNGFMYENQFCQSRQNEANFLAMDRNSNQRHFIPSKGLSVHELHQSGGPDHLTRAAVKPEASESPVNFNLFGSQQQRSHQQSSIQPPLQHQQSGISNMQQLQQHLMIRKMQELQRRQQLQQLDLRQHSSNNEVNPFAKPTCSSQSSFAYGTPNSDTLQYPWAPERGTNWMNRSSPTLQGSPSGHGFPPTLGQTQQLVDLMPQQVDQSLYGVPISSSKGLPGNQYSRMVTARSSTPQMPISSNHLQGNELNLLSDQVGAQNEPSISRHKFQNDNTFGLASGMNTGMRNIGGLQQVNSMSRSVLQQDFLGRQEIAVRPETSHEKLSRQVASPQNEVALDPTEEKILFGSDDNIWDAFGNSPHMSGEAGNAFDNGGLSSGLPSIQSGRWSALMQSAVAETSSSDIVPPEEWSGLILHKNDDLSRDQPPSTHNGRSIQQTSLADENIRITSALNSESFPPASDIDTANAIVFKRFGENFQNEPGQTLQTEMSDRSLQSLEESGKRPNSGPLHHLVSERSQICGDSLQHSLLAEISTKTNSPTWMPGQTGTGLQSNGWNPQAAIPPRGDRVTVTHEAEKLQQNFRNSEVRMMQGDMVHRSSLWNSNSVHSSEIKLGHVNSIVGNHQENQGILSSKDASVAKSCNAQIHDETSSYVQNSYLLNQWKNAHPPARSQGGGSLGRLLHQANDLNHAVESTNNHEKGEAPINEMDNCDGKENSNDSHRSNLSQHTSGGFRESGLSDVSDSQSFPSRKHKSTNQLSRKVPAPDKFHYHPMNLDADADAKSTYDLKQSTRVQATSQQNTHFALSKMFGQIPRHSTVTEKGQSSELHRDTSGTAKEPDGNLSGHTPNVPLPFTRTTDAHTSNNASLSSQNMLELLHKVDQSRNHSAVMQFRSSEYSSSRQPEAENSDGFGHLQQSQFSVSQGFGLQLGPPSQKLRVLNHSLSSQNDQGTFSSSTAAAAAGMGDKGQQIVPSLSVQSLPSAEEAQVDFELSRSATPVPGSNDSSFHKTPESFISALHSGTPHSRGIVQNQQIARVSGQRPMTHHIDSFNGNTSHPAQRRSSETLLPDASSSFRQDNLASSGGMSQQSRPDDVQERFQTDSASSSDHERTSRQFGIPGLSEHENSAQYNMWTNVSKLQHNMGAQFQQVSSRIPESPLPNIVESSSASLMQGYVNSEAVANGEEQRLKEVHGQPIASVNMDTVTKMIKPLGKAPSMKKLADDPSSSALKQKDIEAFGRSLKPNGISHQNYLSQSQMEVLKDGEIGSGDRASKRMRGPDNNEDAQLGALRAGQHNEHNAVVGASIGSSSGPQTEDCKSLGFSRPLDILQRKVSPQGNVASDDRLGLNRDVSQRFSCSDHMISVRSDHPQVSPQMASSWFSQYGTFSNGQMLQVYGAQQVTPIKPGETPFTKASSDLDSVNPEVRGTAAPSDTCQMNSSHQTSSLVANGHFTSLQSPQRNITGQHRVVLRPKKQTKGSPGLHPWHKEISQDSEDLWSLSMAEADWNKAANHNNEKVEDDAELIEDGPPVLRSKRRLILTTRLMQQLLPPAPADAICADASRSYEILAYCVSRKALGDACSMSCRSSNLDVPCDNTDLLLAKGELPERIGCLSHAKATEELMERARTLEYDLSRLDKSASILDLRVEYLELEKFSTINRFAKFHGRGQSDNAETASIDVNANMQKYIAQRYVTALPMPKSLPDGVQCLSL